MQLIKHKKCTSFWEETEDRRQDKFSERKGTQTCLTAKVISWGRQGPTGFSTELHRACLPTKAGPCFADKFNSNPIIDAANGLRREFVVP
ncbi:hypothetical protein KI659_07670 [Litoribacter alkaliphilus]|uniref:Uncharacterized protein n=1 Tax=Litoribacter ruber TaxID=702568 RepID=A0AAP2CJU2_9BACT|nr:hypothetical protein [Litoribacter alkaliphilus]MBS9523890.1 hypothetical protein [Litoribacter alkaliphilus]